MKASQRAIGVAARDCRHRASGVRGYRANMHRGPSQPTHGRSALSGRARRAYATAASILVLALSSSCLSEGADRIFPTQSGVLWQPYQSWDLALPDAGGDPFDVVATVDFSHEFEGTDDSAVVAQRMAQVVFTLTTIPHVTEVLFRQEGKAIPARTDERQLVTRPVMKADYLDFAASLTVEKPVYGGTGGSPLHVTGFGAAFEASFSYALTNANGLIIAEGHAMTTNGTGWGGFDFTIPYKVDSKQTGALIVWVNSAENGSHISVREYPVTLVP